jgi:hypothetical protein
VTSRAPTRRRAPASRRGLATPELDRQIADARARTTVVWRGERILLPSLPERIARLDDRMAREQAYAAYGEALDALSPLYESRLAAWREAGDVRALAAQEGTDPVVMAADLERLSFNIETPYFAALRRYLALIGIEQGDATEADLWYIERGSSWSSWFGPREVSRALAATRRQLVEVVDLDGWRAVGLQLRGEDSDVIGTAVVGAAYATLISDPAWLAGEIGVTSDQVAAFVDFATFVRLLHLRRAQAELTYELRLYTAAGSGLERAYFAGIVGHVVGAAVAESGYLAAIDRPFGSVRRLETALLGAMLVEVLEARHGARWWSDPETIPLIERIGASASLRDTLGELGYDGLDWRPVLRQIRTRLIGEMSGYGGPNITTRAGTRKV